MLAELHLTESQSALLFILSFVGVVVAIWMITRIIKGHESQIIMMFGLFLIGVGIATILVNLFVLVSKRAESPPSPFAFLGPLLAGVITIAMGISVIRRRNSGPSRWLGRIIERQLELFRRSPRDSTKATDQCESSELVDALIQGRISAIDERRLLAHLQWCMRCQAQLERSVNGTSRWSEFANRLGSQPMTHDFALRQAMDKLKGEHLQSVPALHRSDAGPTGHWSLGFLDPPEKLGQLGRFGRYDVFEEIGRGGMGVVLKAFDPSLHRVVAIKVLAPHLATSDIARRRFTREAQAAAAVSHDHVVTIHEVNEANGLPYIAMQYVPGVSLEQKIDRVGPLELNQILRIAHQAACGLAAAHARGLVHRDIKPANIFLEDGIERVKLTDFGLARAIDDTGMTQSGFVAGTPQYMSPEQARGDAVDHRTDLFSLGSTLYAMCTGRAPFKADSTLAVLRKVREETPRPINELNANVPPWLVAVIEKLLAKNPDDRIQSASEIAEILNQHLAHIQQGTPLPETQLLLRSPLRSEAQAKGAGLPSSLTICPSCGANLNVPDNMIGQSVDCPECGKPFRVEDRSKVIEVALPRPAPQLRDRVERMTGARAKSWKKPILLAVVVILLVCCAAIGTFMLFFTTASLQKERSSSVSASSSTVPDPSNDWRIEALSWFPRDASTVVGGINFRKLARYGVDQDVARTVIERMLPAGQREFAEFAQSGKLWFDRISFAYGTDLLEPGPERFVIRISGTGGGHKQLTELLAKIVPDGEIDHFGDQTNIAITTLRRDAQVALGVVGDNDVLIAGYPDGGPNPHHLILAAAFVGTGTLKSPEAKKVTTAEMLGSVPIDAYAFVVGPVSENLLSRCGMIPEPFPAGISQLAFSVNRKHENEAIRFQADLAASGTAIKLLSDNLDRWRWQRIRWLKEQAGAKKDPRIMYDRVEDFLTKLSFYFPKDNCVGVAAHVFPTDLKGFWSEIAKLWLDSGKGGG